MKWNVQLIILEEDAVKNVFDYIDKKTVKEFKDGSLDCEAIAGKIKKLDTSIPSVFISHPEPYPTMVLGLVSFFKKRQFLLNIHTNDGGFEQYYIKGRVPITLTKYNHTNQESYFKI